MRRVMVLGASGAGKSTLARTLGGLLDLRVVHLDRLYWQPGWTHVTREEFRERQSAALATERWITDGNYSHSFEFRTALADTALVLTSPALLSLWRVFRRRWQYRGGRTRPSMADGCPERVSPEFVRYILRFNRTRLPRHVAAAREALGDDRVLVLRDRDAVNALVDAVRQIQARESRPNDALS